MAISTLTPKNRGNWSLQSQGMYALALVNINSPSQKLFTTLAAASAVEFVFKMNPKSLDLEEPASVIVTPTQDGSSFVEHQGSVFKNITIAGTTGLRPNKGQTASIIPILGIPNPL